MACHKENNQNVTKKWDSSQFIDSKQNNNYPKEDGRNNAQRTKHSQKQNPKPDLKMDY